MKMSKFIPLTLCLALMMVLSACQIQSRSARIETMLFPAGTEIQDSWFTSGTIGKFVDFGDTEQYCVLSDTQIYGPFDREIVKPATFTEIHGDQNMLIEVSGEELRDGVYIVVRTLVPGIVDDDFNSADTACKHTPEESQQLLEDGVLDQWVEKLATQNAEDLAQSFYYESGAIKDTFASYVRISHSDTLYALSARTITGPFTADSVSLPCGFLHNNIYTADDSMFYQVKVSRFSEGFFVCVDEFLTEDDPNLEPDCPTTFVQLDEAEAEAYIADGFLADLGLTPDTLTVS